MAKSVAVVKEPPQIHCSSCKNWVVSNEKHNQFSSIDGVPQKLTLWVCPKCRGDAPSPEPATAADVVWASPSTQADVAKAERNGPMQQIVKLVGKTASGKFDIAELTCGHQTSVFPNAKRTRCRKCRVKKGVV